MRWFLNPEEIPGGRTDKYGEREIVYSTSMDENEVCSIVGLAVVVSEDVYMQVNVCLAKCVGFVWYLCHRLLRRKPMYIIIIIFIGS